MIEETPDTPHPVSVLHELVGTLAISLTVKDLALSLDWYQRVLGFSISERFERNGAMHAAAVTAGDVRILLGQDDGAKGWTRVKGEGFAFQIVTTQNIDHIAGTVTRAGAALDMAPIDTPWGARLFRVTDPDGFRISISSMRRRT